jgi:hypothetical protein
VLSKVIAFEVGPNYDQIQQVIGTKRGYITKKEAVNLQSNLSLIKGHDNLFLFGEALEFWINDHPKKYRHIINHPTIDKDNKIILIAGSFFSQTVGMNPRSSLTLDFYFIKTAIKEMRDFLPKKMSLVLEALTLALENRNLMGYSNHKQTAEQALIRHHFIPFIKLVSYLDQLIPESQDNRFALNKLVQDSFRGLSETLNHLDAYKGELWLNGIMEYPDSADFVHQEGLEHQSKLLLDDIEKDQYHLRSILTNRSSTAHEVQDVEVRRSTIIAEDIQRMLVLNTIIGLPDFYDRWLVIHGGKQRGDTTTIYNQELIQLISETASIRKRAISSVRDISAENLELIKRLNRRLLEYSYGVFCPKSGHSQWVVETVLKALSDLSLDKPSKINRD